LSPLPDAPVGYAKYALPATSADTGRYQLYIPLRADRQGIQLQCTDARWAAEHQIMDHCLARFMYNDDIYVEIKFSTQARGHWPQLREATKKLVGTFQVRR
jgi:hypothetical protein